MITIIGSKLLWQCAVLANLSIALGPLTAVSTKRGVVVAAKALSTLTFEEQNSVLTCPKIPLSLSTFYPISRQEFLLSFYIFKLSVVMVLAAIVSFFR